MLAARNGQPECVQLLLAAGASADVIDDRGQTALMWASVKGNVEAVELLLKANVERDRSLSTGFNALFFAARGGYEDVVQILLKDGADADSCISSKKSRGRLPRNGTSALRLAMENGHFEVAEMLLDAGADPNTKRDGYTPLHVMSWVRKPRRGDGIDGAPPPRGSGQMTSLEFTESLIARGADVNAQLEGGNEAMKNLSRRGASPFLFAARTADLPLMKLLLAHDADPHLPNSQGRTPLLAAAGVALGPEADEAASEADAIVAVNFLLSLGADIDHIDKHGDTVMHAAAYKQSPKLVHLLSEADADIAIWNKKNKAGWTPLIIAQGFRFGNYKPSAPTIAALSEVMLAAGVEVPEARLKQTESY